MADDAALIDRSDEIIILLECVEDNCETPIIAIEAVAGALVYLVKTYCLVDDKKTHVLSLLARIYDDIPSSQLLQ